MSHVLVVDLARNMLMTALLIAAPMLVVALAVGLVVSVIQAVTQVQEQTISFVPKLVAVGATFIIIDIVVSSVLMSMGMFMLPPAMISLPFKLLLFVLVDGWSLIVQSLITSFR